MHLPFVKVSAGYILLWRRTRTSRAAYISCILYDFVFEGLADTNIACWLWELLVRGVFDLFGMFVCFRRYSVMKVNIFEIRMDICVRLTSRFYNPQCGFLIWFIFHCFW